MSRWIQLLLLTAAEASAVYSRTSLGPLQETARTALGLSDNYMALLQGPALALPMVIAALPVGLLIDRRSRTRLLLLFGGLNVLASVGTACAPNFVGLFISRAVIGLIAAATPIAVCSLISDLYPPDQRGRATTVMAIGGVGGMSLAFALGGELVTAFGAREEGWRYAQLSLAAPLVLVAILMLALREPSRGDMQARAPTTRNACAALWRLRGILAPLLAGAALVSVADGAALVWSAPTMARQLAISPDRIGALMGTVLLVGGTLGPLCGGLLADFAQRVGGPRRTMAFVAGIACIAVPAASFALLPNAGSMALLLALFLLVGSAIAVALSTVSIVILPNELRGLCMALTATVGAIFGFALAPLTVSLLSAALGGIDRIGQALAMVCMAASLLGAIALALGVRSFPTCRPNA